ncbi:DNA alkylation response protein [Pseudooceanicola sediminis]|uniref:DNA alkylation response protein n=1 Tax=Pseudooceanicola sediminis TaxID=2211117 RepID=A0A399J0C7_9RHOB|nr:acyl-CoA dehydrogenase family protein [Pseudooceanicola sediminis]KAA2313883.1 DNA alkylation response protein [Puniceibacterium sp. HSS470]RII38700.1 DNA alkylation response protein [Pseudooceanicola sediminis]|tara:strand:+ start:1775 stop:3394 length:1620 start_codon:yes stop_codon:yes gene_type:complete
MIQAQSHLATHDVTNQPGPRGDVDLWQTDLPLREAISREGGDPTALAPYGAQMGAADTREDGALANRHTPEMHLFDRAGRRLDEVRFHPSYHALMRKSTAAGYSAIAWDTGATGGHVTHAAMVYLASQAEPGHCCPLTMSYAATPALAASPDLAALWLPRLHARRYDPSIRPVAQKDGATLGMAMTEKQGGSDVRTNTTTATRDGNHYRLTGHKWFCSAPMSDGFLTLAQAPDGLTCFLVPRWLDGARNTIRLQRLKDKLGNRSNASSEIEFDNTFAQRLGDEGRGVQTIIQMVHHTRLDTAMAPAGLMRAALAEAHHWARHRTAFQKRLIDQPLMRAVLADLALEVEAALALGLRTARAFDGTTEQDRAFARLGVALAKFHNNKRAPLVTYEAMEALGGMGYVEDTPMPLLYREAPLNGIWEGSGNVICLDILRTLARDPLAAETLRAELTAATGANRHFDAALAAHAARWPALPPEAEARWFAERTALLLQASLLIRHAPAAVSDAFTATRLAGEAGRITGAIPDGDVTALLARIAP